MPDMATGGRAKGEAGGVPPQPGEDSRFCLGKQALDLASLTKKISMLKKKNSTETGSIQVRFENNLWCRAVLHTPGHS